MKARWGALVIILSVILYMCGCESVNVGGRGKVGPVRGGGNVVFDVPLDEKE